MRLSTFAAAPRVVSLGGVEVLAGKLRVRDLAYLESWLAEAVPEPGPGEEPIPGGWPPTPESEAGIALLQSGEGVARLVYCSLRQTVEGMTLGLARDLAGTIGPDECGPFFAAVFPQPDPSPEDRRRPGPRSDWFAQARALIDIHHYTPDVVLDLPLDQFFGLLREPKSPTPARKFAVPVAGPADLDRLWAERLARAAVDPNP